jgi:sigma-B regulation protein RsbU (phosphoserine phosphatase)
VTDLQEFFLFLYTDGVTETINEAGTEFGFEALLDYFKDEKNHLKGLKTIHQDLIVALDHFKGRNGYHDDITMLSCRVG